MRDLIFSIMFILMVPIALKYVHLGVMLWVWSSLWPPNDYLFGFAQSLPFNKITVATTIVALFLDKRKNISIDVILGVLLLLLTEVSFSYIFSEAPAGWGDDLYQRFIKVVCAALFIRFAVIDRLRLHSIVLVICLAVGAGMADEGLKFLLSGGVHHVKGPSPWGDENSTAAIILMSVPLLIYVGKYSINKKVKAACAGGVILSVVSVVGTYSRGGFIGLTVLLFSHFSIIRKKLAFSIVILMLILIGASLAPDSWVSRISSTGNAQQDSSFMGRVIQWKILTLMALDHPLLGGGILANVYGPIWSSYAARLQTELTFVPTPPPSTPLASHSIYFQILGENGFIGLAIFVALYMVAFSCIRKIKKAVRNKDHLAWAGDIAIAIRLSLILYLVTGAALPIPYLEFPYLLLGCVSALRAIQIKEAKI